MKCGSLFVMLLLVADFNGFLAEDELENSMEVRQLLYHYAIDSGDISRVENWLQLDNNERFDNGETPIYVATAKGAYDVVKYLLDWRAEPNILNENGRTALYIAAEKGFEEIAQLLIDNAANVSIVDKNGHSPLYIALKEGQRKIAVMLIEHGSNVNIDLKKWRSLIFSCAVQTVDDTKRKNALISKLNKNRVYVYGGVNSTVALEHVIETGDAFWIEFIINCCYKGLQSIPVRSLHLAVRRGDDKAIDILIQYGVDVNEKDSTGTTVLHVAIETGSTKMVECLIRNSADVNAKDGQGISPLMRAMKKGKDQITLLLIENGADSYLCENTLASVFFGCIARNASSDVINALTSNGIQIEQYRNDSLWSAVQNDDVEMVETLCKCGIDINEKNRLGKTALHIAIENGSRQMVECLIENSANVIATDEQGNSPLTLALKKGNDDITLLLLENKAHSDLVSKSWEPTLFACITDILLNNVSSNVVKALTEHGVLTKAGLNWKQSIKNAVENGDVIGTKLLTENCVKIMKYTKEEHLLNLAAEKGHVEIARILIEKGADVSEDIDYVGTPLHSAVTLGHLDVARLLIEKGADVNAVNNDYDSYRTPLHMAVVGGSVDIVKLLIEKGADVNAVDMWEYTPYEYAIEKGKLDIANVLKEAKEKRSENNYQSVNRK